MKKKGKKGLVTHTWNKTSQKQGEQEGINTQTNQETKYHKLIRKLNINSSVCFYMTLYFATFGRNSLNCILIKENTHTKKTVAVL